MPDPDQNLPNQPNDPNPQANSNSPSTDPLAGQSSDTNPSPPAWATQDNSSEPDPQAPQATEAAQETIDNQGADLGPSLDMATTPNQDETPVSEPVAPSFETQAAASPLGESPAMEFDQLKKPEEISADQTTPNLNPEENSQDQTPIVNDTTTTTTTPPFVADDQPAQTPETVDEGMSAPAPVPEMSNPQNPDQAEEGMPVPPPAPELATPQTEGQPDLPPPLGTDIPGDGTPPPPEFTAPPVPSQGGGEGGQPLSANASMASDLRPKSGLKKILLLALAAIVILAGIGFLVIKVIMPMLSGGNSPTTPSGNEGNSKTNQQPEINLTYWGLWEPNEVLTGILSAYEQQNPSVKINYRQQSVKDYRERLQSAIASGQGPDVFRYHATWLPMLKNNLQPDSAGNIDLTQYFPIVKENVTIGGETFGVPLGFDSLALFYNPTILQRAGQKVPKTWDELRDVAKKVRTPAVGKIQIAGVALGTTNNVDHFSDILGLMMLQNGADPANPSSTQAEDALTFYTLFSQVDKVWDETLPASHYAFATEKVAMMFAPSWWAFEIAEINPSLQFKTAPVPQLPGTKIAWATYWVEGVSRQSKNKDEAWKFLAYLSKDENLTKLYTAQAGIRMFGEPYPKMKLAETISPDSVEYAFIEQGSYAKSWYMSARTFDNGLNDGNIKYYEDAINGLLSGQTLKQVLPTLSQGLSQVLARYGLVTSAPSAPSAEPSNLSI